GSSQQGRTSRKRNGSPTKPVRKHGSREMIVRSENRTLTKFGLPAIQKPRPASRLGRGFALCGLRPARLLKLHHHEPVANADVAYGVGVPPQVLEALDRHAQAFAGVGVQQVYVG